MIARKAHVTRGAEEQDGVCEAHRLASRFTELCLTERRARCGELSAAALAKKVRRKVSLMPEGKRSAWVELPCHTGATMFPVLALNASAVSCAVRAADVMPNRKLASASPLR